MAEAVKITSLELENVKRVKAVALEPKADGLTVIGGRNRQGKTSVLDAICWALGGKKFEPADPRRDGSVSDPVLRVELSNGLIVERTGKNGSLKVTDANGMKGGQALLDSFTEQLALDLPRFMGASDKEKAQTLLKIIGVGDELEDLDRREAALSQQRLAAGQVARRARGAAESMPWYPDAPEEHIDIAALVEQQRAAMERNAENQRARDRLQNAEFAHEHTMTELKDARARVDALETRYDAEEEELRGMSAAVGELVDVDASGMTAQIESAQEANALLAANSARDGAIAEADRLEAEYGEYDARIQGVRAERMALLEGAAMPLQGLSVEGGSLAYLGHAWGDMSGSEQLMVATAIVRALKPECGFVLIDKLEQMDTGTLAEFGAWCEGQGLQVIGTRVSTGGECSIVIEDGMVARAADPEQTDVPASAPADAQTLQPVMKGIEPPQGLLAPAAGERRF